MKFYNNKGLLFILSISLLLVNAVHSQKFTIPQKSFPEPTGPYNVGTQEFLWIDDVREDDLTPNKTDKVHILIQVWYPTGEDSGLKKSYISNPNEFGDNPIYNKLQSVKTNAFVDASLSIREEKYPVLIFSHGARMSRFTNTFQAEHLASHGYIVFGIDHPSFNQTTLYPDGLSTQDRKDFFYFDKIKDPYLNAIKGFEIADQGIINYWAKDVEFVINEIETINNDENSFLFRKNDLENLGMYGYSLGGILTLQMCAQNSRIKAGLNSDGSILGYAWKTGITQPFLFIKPTELVYTKEEAEDQGQDYEAYLFNREISQLREEFLIKNSNNEMYFLRIQNTKHNNFNDMALFEPQKKDLIEVQLAHKIINDYTLSFFNKYLKNVDDNLFETYPGKYKEAILEKK